MTHIRPYLSWSQLNLWEQDPNEYIRQYVYGEKKPPSKEMDFGSKIAKMLETGIMDDGYEFLVNVPRYALAEAVIEIDLPHKKGIVPLLAKLDSVKDDLSAFYEYKTGKSPWTQARADQNGQVTFYAMCIWLKTRQIPKCSIVWLPTTDNKGGIKATGELKEFETERSLADILAICRRCVEAWQDINSIIDKTLF